MEKYVQLHDKTIIPEKEFLKMVYKSNMNFVKSNMADMIFRLGFDTRKPDTGEPDRKFLEDQIKKYKEIIEIYKKQIKELEGAKNEE